MKKLTSDFYLREDVLQIARDLIGKELITNINGTITSGIITETEAYAGVADRASHAYCGRRTNRTETMYASGGISYVYLCYGIHHLFNVVTNAKEVPHAVLIRNIQPLKGLATILERRRKKKIDKTLSTGPGTMSEALGIKTLHNGFDLTGDTIWIEDAGITIANEAVKITPRIGVDYAGEDAKLPYRFLVDTKL